MSLKQRDDVTGFHKGFVFEPLGFGECPFVAFFGKLVDVYLRGIVRLELNQPLCLIARQTLANWLEKPVQNDIRIIHDHE